MTQNKTSTLRILQKKRPLIVGFMPENDCASIVMAHELGLYRHYGLDVELLRQASWRNVHDNLVAGDMDAAHAPGTLPFLLHLGLTPEKCNCVTGMVLSLQGNAITISRKLFNRGVRDGTSLRQ